MHARWPMRGTGGDLALVSGVRCARARVDAAADRGLERGGALSGLLRRRAGLAGAVSRSQARVRAGRARSRDRETALFYGSIAILTFWATLGPRAGLYTVLYYTIPVFSFLRAPGAWASS